MRAWWALGPTGRRWVEGRVGRAQCVSVGWSRGSTVVHLPFLVVVGIERENGKGRGTEKGECRLESLGSGCNVGSRQSVTQASGQLEEVLGACSIVWYENSIIIIWTHAYGRLILDLLFSSDRSRVPEHVALLQGYPNVDEWRSNTDYGLYAFGGYVLRQHWVETTEYNLSGPGCSFGPSAVFWLPSAI
jgi:hypothetical protein